MYALIYKSGVFLGLYSSKKKMREMIEEIIKDDYIDSGCYGHYHFRYTKVEVDRPTKHLFSMHTLHPEYFENEVETDWSTGEILKL